MPYQILPMNEVRNFVRETVKQINDGLFDVYTHDKIEAFVPKEITITAVIVSKVQSIPVATVQSGTDTSLQTGTDTAVTSGTVDDDSTQTTTHGETVSTTDSDQTELQAGDSTTAPVPPYLGLQSQPFPV